MAINEETYWAAISTVIRMEMTARDNMSQAKLAEAVGVGREAMNKYLAGKSEMPVKLLVKVANALGVTPIWILTEADRRMK